jgi:hypothetical protein
MDRLPAGRLPFPWWIGPALLLFAEFWLFDQVGAHHHTWIFPRWNDQIQYLSECYTGFENARAHGLLSGLRDALLNRSAQGTLHDVWAILLFSATGASRSAALSLNFLWFAAWQIAVFATTLRSTRSAALALIAAGLVLALKSPWAVSPGSAIDFRLDWFAAATMGLALVAAQRTDRFRRCGASALFGVAVALVLLTRFLTGTYFLLIYLVFLVWILTRPGRLRSVGNLGLSALIAAALAGPIFWINRETVYDYYLIGHFTGPESALRSRNMGLSKAADWLFSYLGQMHVGPWFGFLFLGLGAVGLVGALLWPKTPAEPNFTLVPRFTSFVPAVAFLLCPALILILHVQKSEFVLGIMIPGVFGLAWALLERPLRVCREQCLRWIAAATVALSLGVFAQRMLAPPYSPEFEATARHVNDLADYIARRSTAAGLATPRVAVDRVTDCLDAQVLRVICYERQHRFISLIMTLPTGIGEEKPALYWERLKASDFVFLTEDGDPGGWPYDHQLASMRPETWAWAQKNLKLIDRISFPGFRMALFERPDLPN